MKKIILSLCAVGLLGSCQQMCQMQSIPVKQSVASKSIAFPATPATAPVADASPLAFGLVGAALINSNANTNAFLNKFKDELRKRGWKIVVSGITGRAGSTNSVNSGASFTVIGVEGVQSVNLSIVENKSGEEIMLIRGCTMWGVDKKVKESVDVLESLLK